MSVEVEIARRLRDRLLVRLAQRFLEALRQGVAAILLRRDRLLEQRLTARGLLRQDLLRRIELRTIAALGLFMPDDTPIVNQFEAHLAGARVYLVNGLINDCGRIVREGVESMGWFDMSTLKEPYRLEGKKTMGLELAEQLGWSLPGSIFYPTGGGTGLIGMWKAFEELRYLGWLRDERLPRLVSCQSDGCAPIVRAFERGERFAELFPNAHTRASGLRVPAAVGDFMMLDAIRASGGTARCGREGRILEWMRRVAGFEGIAICPETAVCFDVLSDMAAAGEVRADEEVVVFNTGAAQKYPEVVPLDLPRLDKDQPINYEALVS